MELTLPMNFENIEHEALMYLDGGGYWTQHSRLDWTYTFDRYDCASMAEGLKNGATVAATIASYCPDPSIRSIAAMISTFANIGSFICSIASDYGNGIRVYFRTLWWGRTPRWVSII